MSKLNISWQEESLNNLDPKMGAGGTPRRNNPEYWKDGTIPWVKITDLHQGTIKKTEECITEKGLNESSAKIFKRGTVLISIFASVGEVGILDIDAATNQAIVGIRPDETKIDNKYLYHFLRYSKSNIDREGQKGTQRNINLEILKKIRIKYCDLSTQKRIIAVLDTVNQLSQKRKEALELTGKLILSIFVRYFGDPAINSHEWKSISLKEVMVDKLQNGLFKTDSMYGKGTKVVWVENILSSGCKLNTYNLKKVELSEKEISKYRLSHGDVLITRSSHIGKDGVGVINVVDNPSENLVFESHIMKMKLDDHKMNPYYLATYFKTKYARNLIIQSAKRGTMTTIAQPEVLDLPILLPPKDLQDKFESAIKKIESSIERQLLSLESLENLINSLNQKIFNIQ